MKPGRESMESKVKRKHENLQTWQVCSHEKQRTRQVMRQLKVNHTNMRKRSNISYAKRNCKLKKI
jgi:hypothetical protein